MKSTGDTLQVEITIAPPKRRTAQPAQQRELPTPPRISRITRLMALAIKFQDMVDRGEVGDYADLARLGYVSRARITQIMNLLNLSPQIQEALLLPKTAAAEAICEHLIRSVSRFVLWDEQNEAFRALPPIA